MFKEIKVGNITVPMLANAATPLRYKHIFGKDIIKEFQAAQGDMTKVTDSIPELAYIMARAAEAHKGDADLNLLNENDFIEWLEQFEPMDLVLAAEDIVDLYIGNGKTASEPKKKEKKQ